VARIVLDGGRAIFEVGTFRSCFSTTVMPNAVAYHRRPCGASTIAIKNPPKSAFMFPGGLAKVSGAYDLK
jgi:hypothetical protein